MHSSLENLVGHVCFCLQEKGVENSALFVLPPELPQQSATGVSSLPTAVRDVDRSVSSVGFQQMLGIHIYLVVWKCLSVCATVLHIFKHPDTSTVATTTLCVRTVGMLHGTLADGRLRLGYASIILASPLAKSRLRCHI